MKWTRARKKSLTFARKITHSTSGESKGIQWDNIPILAGSLNLPVSISIWIKQTLANQSHQHLIFVDQTSADADDGGVRLYESGAGTLVFDIKTSSVFAKYDVATEKTPLNEWVHVAATWQGTVGGTAPKVYVNGNLQTSGTPTVGSGTRSAAGGSHCIGGRNSAINRGWGGLVAGAGKWVRELSAAEVKKLSEGVHPLEFPEGLVICPDFQTLENLAPGTTEKLPNFIEHDGTMYVGPPQLQYRKPRFALADVPTDTRHVAVSKPWTKRPPSTVLASVDFLLVPEMYESAGGWNQGKDRDALQSDTTVSNYSLTNTKIGRGLILEGNEAQKTEFPTGFFIPQDDPKDRQMLTVGAWVSSTDVSDDHQIVGQWRANLADSSWRIELDTTGSALEFRVQAVNDTGDTVGIDITDTGNDISDGLLHFVVATIDVRSGTLQGRAYVDGVLVGTDTGSTDAGWNEPTTPGPVTIGIRDEVDAEPFNGTLGGLFLDRSIWSDAKIARAYRNPWVELFKPSTIFAPIPETLPDIAKVDITRTDMPLKPPL
jgi:hypothetical protein